MLCGEYLLLYNRQRPAGVGQHHPSGARHKSAGRAQKLIVAGCLVERFRSEIQKISRKWTRSSEPGNWRTFSPPGSRRPTRILRFRILSSRPEGDAREAGPLCAMAGTLSADLPVHRRDHAPCARDPAYIKIAEAAIIPAPSASFPSCAGNLSVRAGLNRWWRRLCESGVREITLIGRPPPATAGLALKDGLAQPLAKNLPRSKTCAGSASYTPTRTKSRLACSKPSRLTTRSAPFPCSTHQRPVLKRMKRVFRGDPSKRRPYDSERDTANILHRRLPRRNRMMQFAIFVREAQLH